MIDDDKFIDTGVNTGSEGSTLRGTSPSSQHGLLDSPVGFKCTIGSSRSSKLVATASPDTPDASPVIWVDFAPLSPQDPFHFTRKTKARIMALVLFFAFFTCFEMSTFAISSSSMRADLDMTALQEAAGVSLYGWGFAVGPLVLAPITEEFGRYRVMVAALMCYTLLHLMMTLGTNVATILVSRFLLGLAGCIGPTLTPGFIADIYPPEKRGFPMGLFTLGIISGPGFGGLIMGFVEANQRLQWRWVHWIELIAMGIFTPLVYFGLRETRSTVVLQQEASRLRKKRGLRDGAPYMARSEISKPAFLPAIKASISRPLLFLFLEPIVIFFSIWTAMVWGVYFVAISGLPYVFQTLHQWEIQYIGIAYISIFVGAFFGFLGNFVQDAVYRRRAGKDGAEGRLWASMLAGLLFAGGCFVFGATATSTSSWVGPCLGVVMVLAAAYTILQCCLVYLSNCYGAFASSAVAGMSFARIVVGSSFAMFTTQAFDNLTPRWTLIMMGGIASLLAIIPFLAFFLGPWIRDHSPYSKQLMEEEAARLHNMAASA